MLAVTQQMTHFSLTPVPPKLLIFDIIPNLLHELARLLQPKTPATKLKVFFLWFNGDKENKREVSI
jgi:hypothetical protein